MSEHLETLLQGPRWALDLPPSMCLPGWDPKVLPMPNPKEKSGCEQRVWGREPKVSGGWGQSQEDDGVTGLLTWLLRLRARSQAWGKTQGN